MFKNPLSSLKEKITQYVHLKFELIRLEVIERLVNVMGYFAFIMIAIFLFFTFGMFVLLGVAEYLKVLFGSAVWGYLATALIILIITFIVVGFSKKIIRFFAGKLTILLTKNYHEEDDDSDENAEG
jgi:multisubunit Na+/H+ antiporter MnhC subunit